MDPARGPMHSNAAMPNNQNFFGGYDTPVSGSPLAPFAQMPPHTPTHNIEPLMHAAPQSPVHFFHFAQATPLIFNTQYLPEPPFVAPISPIPPSGSPHFYPSPKSCGYDSPGYMPAPQNTPMTPYAVANWNGIRVPAGHHLAQPTDLDKEVGPVAPRKANSAMAVMTKNCGQEDVPHAGSPGCHMPVARARKSAGVYRSTSVSESLDPPSTPRSKNLVKTAVMGSYMRSQTDVGRGSHSIYGHAGHANLGSPFLPHPLYKTRACNKYNELTGCPYAERCLFRHPGDPPTPLSGSASAQQRFFPPGTPGRMPLQSPFFLRNGRYPGPRGQLPRGPDGREREMNLDTVAQALNMVEKRGATALKRYNSEPSLGQHTYSLSKEFRRREQGESEQQ